MTAEYCFDIVVVGGGLAGICAALASAGRGRRVAIINDRPVFGGCSSSEIRVPPMGSALFNGWAGETGLIEEILLGMGECYEKMEKSRYDSRLFEILMGNPFIDPFLGCTLCGVEMVPSGRKEYEKKIGSIDIIETGTAFRMRFRAEQFIDCTGDGVLAFLSGASYRYGREGRGTHGEALAPLEADRHTMGSTIKFEAADRGFPHPFEAPSWAYPYKNPEEFLPDRDPISFRDGKFGGYWWMEVCGEEYDQALDVKAMREELLRHIYGVWDYVKNRSECRGELANYSLEWIGSIPGKRESRRIEGDVLLTEADCREAREWPDSVLTAGWFLDIHTSGGVNNREQAAEIAHIDETYSNYTLVSPFNIPLRCLYSRDVENLWMAGRDISVTHCALGSVRVQNTCANMGQAAGVAASVILETGETPREAAGSDSVRTIQQILHKDDVRILGIYGENPNASFEMSSEAPLAFGEVDGFIDLSTQRAQIIPLCSASLDEISPYLKNESGRDLELSYGLEKIVNIWDGVSRSELFRGTAMVKRGFDDYLQLEIPVNGLESGVYRFSLRCDSPLSSSLLWARSSVQPTGTLAQYYFESEGGWDEKNKGNSLFERENMEIPPFSRWNQYKREGFSNLIRIKPIQYPYGAKSLSTAKYHPEILPNLWISHPSDSNPTVEMNFEETGIIRAIILYFDSDLNRSLSQPPFKLGTGSREFRLYLFDSEWREAVFEKIVRGRRVICQLGCERAGKIRVEFPDADKRGGARLYGIKIGD